MSDPESLSETLGALTTDEVCDVLHVVAEHLIQRTGQSLINMVDENGEKESILLIFGTEKCRHATAKLGVRYAYGTDARNVPKPS